MKKVLLVTDGIFHPPYFGRMALQKSLAEMDGFEFQHIRSMEKLPADLKDSSRTGDLHYHHKRISQSALNSLDAFVSKRRRHSSHPFGDGIFQGDKSFI